MGGSVTTLTQVLDALSAIVYLSMISVDKTVTTKEILHILKSHGIDDSDVQAMYHSVSRKIQALPDDHTDTENSENAP